MSHEAPKSWHRARKRDDVIASLFSDRGYKVYERKPIEIEKDLYEMQLIAQKTQEQRDELIDALRKMTYFLEFCVPDLDAMHYHDARKFEKELEQVRQVAHGMLKKVIVGFDPNSDVVK